MSHPVEFRVLDFLSATREGDTVLIAAQVDAGQVIHLRCGEFTALHLSGQLETAYQQPRTPFTAPLENLSALTKNQS